jgi:ABC-type Fe3+/spermidine/putrescine transport system ATPase subunit
MIGTEDVTGLPPEKREIGMVFQNYALFPHLTVADNIAFPLRMRKVGRGEAQKRASQMLELVDLVGMESRRPGELSGGQQQRVALARALVFEPRVLLLDEPFGALDRRLREQLGLAVRRVQRELGITTIFVTHDQEEAFTMSNRIAVMSAGHILQVDAPGDVYRGPATLQVARMLGQLNEFPMEVVSTNGAGTTLAGAAGHQLAVGSIRDLGIGSRVRCGVRPEHVRVSARADETCTVKARVLAGIFGGMWTRAQLQVGDAPPVMAILPPQASREINDGDEVWFGFEPEHGMLFDEATELRVN